MTGQVPGRDNTLVISNDSQHSDLKHRDLKTPKYPKYLIIGSGRLAKHLRHWLSVLSEIADSNQPQILSWDRSQDPHQLPKLLAQNPVVLLAISDSAIEAFSKKNIQGTDCLVVHFSGAQFFPGMITAHPLMTFGPDLYTKSFYEHIHWTLTGTGNLKDIFPQMNNSFSLVSAEQRPLYHALCVTAGNFPIILWTEVMKSMADLGLEKNNLDLYLEKSVQNFKQLGAQALTGPFPRNDLGTIEKNISALEHSRLQKIYKEFWQLYQSQSLKKECL